LVHQRENDRRSDPRQGGRAARRPSIWGRKPVKESATLKRVRQARRHEIWRVAHTFDPTVAVRILCWFPDDETAVVLIGGDKAGISDIWYDSATPRAEAGLTDGSGRAKRSSDDQA
jgi:hypothetical protein